jgi:hypothetical protein
MKRFLIYTSTLHGSDVDEMGWTCSRGKLQCMRCSFQLYRQGGICGQSQNKLHTRTQIKVTEMNTASVSHQKRRQGLILLMVTAAIISLTWVIVTWWRRHLRHNCIRKNVRMSVTGRADPKGCETSRLPHCLNSRLTDGGELSASPAGRVLLPAKLTFSGRNTHICALRGKVEVTKVHIFVHWKVRLKWTKYTYLCTER